eukprot:365124-Chlamydomonas_euryale.AAC.9
MRACLRAGALARTCLCHPACCMHTASLALSRTQHTILAQICERHATHALRRLLDPLRGLAIEDVRRRRSARPRSIPGPRACCSQSCRRRRPTPSRGPHAAGRDDAAPIWRNQRG